jgi:hypothetical protein
MISIIEKDNQEVLYAKGKQIRLLIEDLCVKTVVATNMEDWRLLQMTENLLDAIDDYESELAPYLTDITIEEREAI